METTNIKEFDFVELKNLYANGQRKDFLDAKEYIDKLFIPLTNGTHALLENKEIIILSKETLNEVYLSRFQKRKRKVKERMFQTILLYGLVAKLGRRPTTMCILLLIRMLAQLVVTSKKVGLGENLSKKGFRYKCV